jgi:predicted NBD/HSP70 family sugar kinase
MASPQPRSRNAPGAGAILQLIRTGEAVTRADIMERTGLSRSTVAQRLEQLVSRRLIVAAGSSASTGGRPPASFAFNPDAGVVLAAGMGATHSRLALTDLDGRVVVEESSDVDITQEPDAVLAWIEERFLALVRAGRRAPDDLLAIGVGVPAPVEHATGTPVSPPIMPGWDGYPIAERLRAAFAVPVLVDNDVNTMAWGEHAINWRDTPHMVYIKVGTGIGLGIVADGRVQRGSDGAAGDIGHLAIPAAEGIRCVCGNTGCLEAVASGRAMAQQLREQGLEARHSRDVVDLARSGELIAMNLVRESGRLIGEALVSAVNLLNPRVIVVGGDMAHADQLLLAGIREAVYQRSLPLATRHLRIVRSVLDDSAGVIGAAMLAIEHVLAPDVVDERLAEEEAARAASRAAS